MSAAVMDAYILLYNIKGNFPCRFMHWTRLWRSWSWIDSTGSAKEIV